MLANEGDGPEEKGEKQEDGCHNNKPADFHCDGKDGRLDSRSNSLHHDTGAAIEDMAGGCICAAGRFFTIVQQSVEDRISETNFVFS